MNCTTLHLHYTHTAFSHPLLEQLCTNSRIFSSSSLYVPRGKKLENVFAQSVDLTGEKRESGGRQGSIEVGFVCQRRRGSICSGGKLLLHEQLYSHLFWTLLNLTYAKNKLHLFSTDEQTLDLRADFNVLSPQPQVLWELIV